MKDRRFSKRVINYILSRSLEELREITLKDITDYVGVSKVYLIKKFKEERGVTPGKFILREKMVRAAGLIERDCKLTVVKITEMIGFCSSDYFIRIFKEHFGAPPQKYRDLRAASQKTGSTKKQSSVV